MEQHNWKSLGIKEKLAIGTAVIAFLCGWVLVGIAAFVPLLISEQSVLWVLGQGMIYSASVFGITGYFSSETRRMRQELRSMINQEKIRLEQEKFEEEQE